MSKRSAAQTAAEAAQKRAVNHTRISDSKGVEDSYDLGPVLGKGSFGVVEVAIHKKTGEKWACKSLDKQKAGSSAVRQLEREVGILKRVAHKHVVQLREVLEAPKKIYLIMELCDGGDLLTCVEDRRYLPERDVAVIMKRLADVIAYLHDNEIVHRDLKLENILLSRADPADNFNIKVSDFGLSYIKGKESAMMSTMCGTPIYMAPEVIAKLGYSQQCDIWSMGIIMYFLLCGSPPFYDKDEEQLYEKINRGEVSFDGPVWASISSQAKNLIQGMLKVDPAHRFTAKEIMDHAWISNRDNAEGTPLASNVLDMMRAYNAERRFKRAIYGVLTARAVGEYFIGYFTSDFRKRRPRGAGKPTKEELEAEAAAAQAKEQQQQSLLHPDAGAGHHKRSPSTHKLGLTVGHSSHNVLGNSGGGNNKSNATTPQKRSTSTTDAPTPAATAVPVPSKGPTTPGVSSPSNPFDSLVLPSLREGHASTGPDGHPDSSHVVPSPSLAHAQEVSVGGGDATAGSNGDAHGGDADGGHVLKHEDSMVVESVTTESDHADDADEMHAHAHSHVHDETQDDAHGSTSAIAGGAGRTPAKKTSVGSKVTAGKPHNGKTPLKSSSGTSMGSGNVTPKTVTKASGGKTATHPPAGASVLKNAASASTGSMPSLKPAHKKGIAASSEKITPLNLGTANGKGGARTPTHSHSSSNVDGERPQSANSAAGEDLKLPRIKSAERRPIES
eukprot:Opistho-2@49823